MKDGRVELSAFIVIVWYICRDKTTLKFSALIRTIVTEATVYFLAMVAMQTYSIVGVKYFPRSLRSSATAECDCCRVSVTNKNSRFCEYAADSEDFGPALNYPPHVKYIWTVRVPAAPSVGLVSRVADLHARFTASAPS